MPLCYGGGIKTVEQAKRIFSLGVEKIALSSSVIHNPNLITQIGVQVGSQSVIVVLDVKRKIFGGYEVFTHNGRQATGNDPLKFIQNAQKLGAGEIVINSIDNDGLMKGYDFGLIKKVRKTIMN